MTSLAANSAARAVPETGVNRAAKADRATVPASAGQSQTISLRPDGLADTSVLVRVPVAREARNEARDRPAPSSVPKSGTRKTAVACEPVVSVLTEVAKLLAARPLRDVSGTKRPFPSIVIPGRAKREHDAQLRI